MELSAEEQLKREAWERKIKWYGSKEEAEKAPIQFIRVDTDEEVAWAHHPTEKQPYKAVFVSRGSPPEFLKHELGHIKLKHVGGLGVKETIFNEICAVLYAAKHFGWDDRLRQDLRHNLKEAEQLDIDCTDLLDKAVEEVRRQD